jgi:hypothetical protein
MHIKYIYLYLENFEAYLNAFFTKLTLLKYWMILLSLHNILSSKSTYPPTKKRNKMIENKLR